MIRTLIPLDAIEVARHMREIDRREICGLHDTNDPVKAIAPLQALSHIGVSVWREDTPICVVGAVFLWPGVASVFMFATDRWYEVAGETTKFVRRVLLPTLRDAGIHRLQCYSLSTHIAAHRWLRWLGADREVLEAEYGKNREDYISFSMSRAALERVTSDEK